MAALVKYFLKPEAAYRPLFLSGWLLALYASLVWLQPTKMPIFVHSEIMFGGFLLSFSAGFLMTAIPRMTGAPATPVFLQLLVLSFLLVGAVFSALQHSVIAYCFYILGSLSLAITLASRFALRVFDPPGFFVFVAMGLFSGIVGQVLILFSRLGILDSNFLALGKAFFFQLMILSFVVGIGSRIIPYLLGWKDEVISPQDRIKRRPFFIFLKSVNWHLYLSAFALFVSFLIEFFWHERSGQIIRAVLVSSLAFGPWRLFFVPRKKSFHSFFLWLSSWAMIAGLWAHALSEANKMHWLHLLYLGSFALMTIMVGTHVVIAHENLSPKKKKSLALGCVGLLLILATISRLGVIFHPEYYFSFMKSTAVLFALALCLWPFVFFAKSSSP